MDNPACYSTSMASQSVVIRRCLMLASVSFLIMTVVCVLLQPQIFEHLDYGLTYFGSAPRTLIPYYTGFAIIVGCFTAIAHQLRSVERKFWPIEVIFWIAGLGMAGIALTSYIQAPSGVLFWVHGSILLLLVTCELAAAIWIIKQPGVTRLDYLLFAVLAAVYISTIIPSFLQLILHASLPSLYLYPLREITIFVCALGLTGRMALRVAK